MNYWILSLKLILIYREEKRQRVKLKDLTNNNEYEFFSLSRAAKFIEDTVGVCDTATLRNNMKNNTTYKKR